MLQGVYQLQFKFVPVLIGDGNKIGAELFTHWVYLQVLCWVYFTPEAGKMQGG